MTVATTPKPHTPGFNRRLAIWKDIDKNGKLRAYHYSIRQFRSFPLRLADC